MHSVVIFGKKVFNECVINNTNVICNYRLINFDCDYYCYVCGGITYESSDYKYYNDDFEIETCKECGVLFEQGFNQANAEYTKHLIFVSLAVKELVGKDISGTIMRYLCRVPCIIAL